MPRFIDRMLALLLRRLRLLTVIALFLVPWVIVSYSPTWTDTLIALAVMAAFACAAALWFRLSGSRNET